MRAGLEEVADKALVLLLPLLEAIRLTILSATLSVTLSALRLEIPSEPHLESQRWRRAPLHPLRANAKAWE